MKVFLLILAAAPHSVSLTIHVAQKTSKHADFETWKEDLLASAIHQFQRADVVLTTTSPRPFSGIGPIIHTPAERNQLSRLIPRKTDGSIHVFIVERLQDKKTKGKWIGGVHWYHAGRRYIIVSRRGARRSTLAHELGHYFRLRHTKDPTNLMMSPGRNVDAQFSDRQLKKIRRSRR